MRPRDSEAQRLEKDYLRRIEEACLAYEAEERATILENIQLHIEQILTTQATPQSIVPLSEMAATLEKLGPPETYKDSESTQPQFKTSSKPSSRSSESPPPLYPTQKVQDPHGLKIFLDRLWLAFLLLTLAFWIPIIYLRFCELAGMVVIMYACYKFRGRPTGFRTLGLWAAAISLFNLASTVSQNNLLISASLMLVEVCLFAVFYVQWISLAIQTFELLGELELVQWLRSTRVQYLILFGILNVSCLSVVSLGAFMGDQDDQNTWADLLAGELIALVVVLPVNWILGWFYLLRPLNRFRDCLRRHYELG